MKIGTVLVKVILALVVIVGISSCTKPGGTAVADSNVDYYTCTMHPSVHSKTPGEMSDLLDGSCSGPEKGCEY